MSKVFLGQIKLTFVVSIEKNTQNEHKKYEQLNVFKNILNKERQISYFVVFQLKKKVIKLK